MKKIAVRLIVPFLFLAGLQAGIEAEEPKPGEIVTVTTKKNEDQQYSCYLPSDYTDERPWPIIYCFAPDGNGAYFVKRLKPVLEKHGWIAAGSLNSKNGMPNKFYEKTHDALWEDTTDRFHLMKNLRYATGFSGGSRVSFWMAKRYPLDGIFAQGAGLSDYEWTPPKDLRVFWTCGKEGFNHPEMTQRLDPILQKNGNPVQYTVFDGGHEPPPKKVWEDAIDFLDRYNMKISVSLYRKQTKISRLLMERKYVKGYEKAKEKKSEEGTKKLLDRLKTFYEKHEKRVYDKHEKSFEYDPNSVLSDAKRVVNYFDGYPPASELKEKLKDWKTADVVDEFRSAKKEYEKVVEKVNSEVPFLKKKDAEEYRKQLDKLSEKHSENRVGDMASDASQAIKDAFERAGYMGFSPDREYEGKGVRIGSVSEETPASRAGLKDGDILLEMGGDSVNGLRSLRSVLQGTQPGDQLELKVKEGKDGDTRKVKITLGVKLSL